MRHLIAFNIFKKISKSIFVFFFQGNIKNNHTYTIVYTFMARKIYSIELLINLNYQSLRKKKFFFF